ncbi:MAG TPA: glycine betaine ABC transporter substrate-binding protein [Acidiphilium sp.]
MRRRTLMAAAAGAGMASIVIRGASAAGKTIVVGGKDFTEQLILAEMTVQLLKAHGLQVTSHTGMGSTVLHEALLHGEIDAYWGYTGTALIVFDKVKKHMSPQQTYETVKTLAAKKGVVWLNPSRANDTYCLVMNKAEAEKLKIDSISDLAKVIRGGKKLTLATDAEFAARSDGLKPLEKAYDFEFGRANLKLMSPGLTYEALHEHRVDVAMAFATDGQIKEFDFVVLKDDKNYFPSYAITPVVLKKTLDANPKLAGLLNGLSARLDDDTMAALNAGVGVEKKSVQAVSRAFLKSQNLI